MYWKYLFWADFCSWNLRENKLWRDVHFHLWSSLSFRRLISWAIIRGMELLAKQGQHIHRNRCECHLFHSDHEWWPHRRRQGIFSFGQLSIERVWCLSSKVLASNRMNPTIHHWLYPMQRYRPVWYCIRWPYDEPIVAELSNTDGDSSNGIQQFHLDWLLQ